MRRRRPFVKVAIAAKQVAHKRLRNRGWDSCTRRRSVWNEIPAAPGLGKVLRAPDEWDEVQCRIHCSAEESFSAHRSAQSQQREDPTNPRHGTVESARHPAAGVLLQLLCDTHGV
jgi:hypothetical protein